MKTLALIKKGIMNSDGASYLIYILSVFIGCIAFIGFPGMLDIQMLNIGDFFEKVLGVIWGMIAAALFAAASTVAKEITSKWWSDKGKHLYDKIFKRKKKKQ